ncbi:hypothetical protein LguiA_001962 [Lonicera macranthoides]
MFSPAFGRFGWLFRTALFLLTEKFKASTMQEEIEEVDDPESNKSGPSKAEKAPNFGFLEFVVDVSESNKAGRSVAVVNSMLHTDLTPTKQQQQQQDKEPEFESLRSQVNELGTQVDYLRSQINDIIFGRRSQSRTPVRGSRSRSRTPVRGRRSRSRTPVRDLDPEPQSVALDVDPGPQSVAVDLDPGPYVLPVGDLDTVNKLEGLVPHSKIKKKCQRQAKTGESGICWAMAGSSKGRKLTRKKHLSPATRKKKSQKFDVDSLDSLLTQVSDLIIQASGGRFQALDLISQADGAGAQALDLTHPKSVMPDYELQALMPRNIVAEEDELKLMRVVTNLKSLVKDLRSQHRSDNPSGETQGGSLRHQYSQQPETGRLSPTLERICETEPSSSSDSQKQRGTGILKD